jgi:predicted transcriptional regulator
VTKKAKTKATKRAKRRTSIWLDDDLRARLDRKAERTERSLAFTIDDMLRKGLAKAEKGEPDAPATVFG